MKCPYCDQDHPDGTEFCPETGKALGQSMMVEPSQVDQSSLTAIVEGKIHIDQGLDISRNPAMPELTKEPSPTETVLPESGMIPNEPSSAEIPSALEPPKKRHPLAWVIGGCVGIPVIILLIVVLVVVLDPFNLHVWGRLDGSYDAAAEVMPADTGLYLGINIGNGLLTRMERVITPFMPTAEAAPGVRYLPAPIDPRHSQQTSPFESLWTQIEDETGIKIPEDISPWVGQYAGVGAVEFMNTSSGLPVPSGWIIAAEARNLSRADKFLVTLQKNLTARQDTEYKSQTYRGVNIYVKTANTNPNDLSFGRSGRMVIIASSLAIIKDAIDRQSGQALPTEQDYSSLVKERAFSWTASFYINHAWIGSYLDTLMKNSLQPAGPLINPYPGLDWTGMLMNLTAIKNGARLDIYVDFTEALESNSDISQIQDTSFAPGQLVQILPQDTVIFMVNNHFDQVIEGMLSSALQLEGDLSEFWDSLDQSLGFSLKDDLLEYLTGQWALYAVPSTKGLLPDQANINLALSLLAQTDEGFKLQAITDGLNQSMLLSGLKLEQQEQDGVIFYELGSFNAFEPILAFGAGNGYFTLGTDVQALRLSASETDSLVNSANYQTAIQALPGQMTPFLYADVENLLANMREGMDASQRENFNDSMKAFAPIRIIVLGNRFLSENIAHSSIAIILGNN